MKQQLFILLATFDVDFTLRVSSNDTFSIIFDSSEEVPLCIIRSLSDLVLSFDYLLFIDATTGYLRFKISKK